jgi:hypothetical protein
VLGQGLLLVIRGTHYNHDCNYATHTLHPDRPTTAAIAITGPPGDL